MASLESKQLEAYIRSSSIWNKPLAEVRRDLENMTLEVQYIKQVEISKASARGVTAEWIIPQGAVQEKVIIYLHGGGYCLGIVDTNRNFVARIAVESGFKVLLPDYRLAPENPFPAGIEDSITVYRWLISEGYLPENIFIVADSSGCGLSLVTLTLLREQGESLPAGLAFMSPAIDFCYKGESITTRADLDPFQMDPDFYIANYYVKDNDPTSPLISPIYAELKGLPPMLIHASDHDIFLSDSIRLAEKAEKAGVAAELKVWEGMWHNFHMYSDYLPEGRTALDEIYKHIKSKLTCS